MASRLIQAVLVLAPMAMFDAGAAMAQNYYSREQAEQQRQAAYERNRAAQAQYEQQRQAGYERNRAAQAQYEQQRQQQQQQGAYGYGGMDGDQQRNLQGVYRNFQPFGYVNRFAEGAGMPPVVVGPPQSNAERQFGYGDHARPGVQYGRNAGNFRGNRNSYSQSSQHPSPQKVYGPRQDQIHDQYLQDCRDCHGDTECLKHAKLKAQKAYAQVGQEARDYNRSYKRGELLDEADRRRAAAGAGSAARRYQRGELLEEADRRQAAQNVR